MKFKNLIIPQEISATKGLPEIKIERLGSLVAFVGKNGCGKTRILDLIEEHACSYENFFNNNIQGLPSQLEEIKPTTTYAKEYILTLVEYRKVENKWADDPKNDDLSKKIKRLGIKLNKFGDTESQKEYYIHLHDQIENMQKGLINVKRNFIKRIDRNEIQALKLAIDNDTPKDEAQSFEQLIENLNINSNELKSINNSALKYLSKLPHQLSHDKINCLLNNENFEETVSYKRFQSLNKFIKDFLRKELSWEQKPTKSLLTEEGNSVIYYGVWKLGNREFDYTELSDGEKTLFAYALLFFLLDQNPTLNIKESVVLIDEPELHLHPDSEIDLIEGLINVLGEKGQLIIATHSINILSTLNYSEIFMVKDGIINHPSNKTPGESLSELMKIEERINKLSSFLTSVSTWSYLNFMAQCFLNPEIIESAKENDPQIEAFKEAVKANYSKRKNMLLDFGAGKGRVLEQLKSDSDFMKRVNYHALEPWEELHEKLNELGAKRVYSRHEELPEKTFDFILVCNVLHEIPIEDWELSLNKLINSLKSDGFLIIIEAKTLSIGEKIGKIGYLLLDIPEIKELFNLQDIPSSISTDERITCTVLNKKDLTIVDKKSILNCLKKLENNTLDGIESLRNQQSDNVQPYTMGIKSAHFSQLHINAKLAIKEMQKLKRTPAEAKVHIQLKNQ